MWLKLKTLFFLVSSLIFLRKTFVNDSHDEFHPLQILVRNRFFTSRSFSSIEVFHLQKIKFQELSHLHVQYHPDFSKIIQILHLQPQQNQMNSLLHHLQYLHQKHFAFLFGYALIITLVFTGTIGPSRTENMMCCLIIYSKY